MMEAQPPLLSTLIDLIQRLYGETEGFDEHPEEHQIWYNRGYANGMVRALDELGYRARIEEELRPDTGDPLQGAAHLPWGKAYQHGLEMGDKETREVIGSLADPGRDPGGTQDR